MVKQLIRLLFTFLISAAASACIYAGVPIKYQPYKKFWQFPLSRTHTGALIGNGKQGLMIWGAGRQLNITISRAGFWDHRGGHAFPENANFKEVKRLIETNNEKALREMFGQGKEQPGLKSFTQIGGARLEIILPEDWQLQSMELDLQTAELKIVTTNPTGIEIPIKLSQAYADELAWLQMPPLLKNDIQLKLFSFYELNKEAMSARGINAPEVKQLKNDGQFYKQITQKLPEDEPLGIAVYQKEEYINIGTALGSSNQSQLQNKIKELDREALKKASLSFWTEYWKKQPKVKTPDPAINSTYEYGLYKIASCIAPDGPVCALQGPFMEEYQMVPWANDYHFNINIQMIYWPLLTTGNKEQFAPLWAFVKKLMPQLKENGKRFFGTESALLLPHAIDDRGYISGSFWAGAIDHGSTAWLAQLAYLYGITFNDKKHLEELAYPLLKGSFEGYLAMSEEITDTLGKKKYSLPVSVSPEFRGSQMTAVGRDASFQLAAWHSTCRLLKECAQTLGKPVESIWAKVDTSLPAYTMVEGAKSIEYPQYTHKRIGLWKGQDLIESHRHHSHLAGIYPFTTINLNDTSKFNQGIIANSLYNWVRKGMGTWAGWSIPWASCINTRVGRIDASISLLNYWLDNYVNEGNGTLHDAAFQGLSTAATDALRRPEGSPNTERMQLDAGFGFMTAIHEIIYRKQGDMLNVLPAIPRQWANYSFENLRTEQGFLISGKVENGKPVEISIKATSREKLKVIHNMGNAMVSYEDVDGRPVKGPVFERTLNKDEVVVLRPNKAIKPKLIDWNPKK